MTTAREVHAQRMEDVRIAVRAGDGFNMLAALWKMSKPGAWMWCNRYCAADSMAALARNGETMRVMARDIPPAEPTSILGDRLAIIAAMKAQGWSISRIARAMGIKPASLHLWIGHNAPDGIDDALSDFSDEPTIQAA